MTRKKQPKLTAKETLLALCSTFSEEKSKQAFILLSEHFKTTKRKILKLDSSGTENQLGLIRLTPVELEKLTLQFGEENLHIMFGILHEYIEYLQAHQDEPKYKRSLNRYKTSTHYKTIKGWVLDRMLKLNPNFQMVTIDENKPVDFYDIQTLSQAREYVKSIPSELRFNNPEIEYLTTQYPELIKELDNAR